MKNPLRLFGALFIVTGLLITLNPISAKFTGFTISESPPSVEQSFAGIWLITAGWSLLLIKRQKKAQASIEFLMTYGWAILATIIAIGAIAYLIVFANKEGVSNSPPLLTPPLIAESAEWKPQSGTYSLAIKNGGSIDLTLKSLKITKQLTGDLVCQSNINSAIKPGDTKSILNIPCADLAGIAGVIEIGFTWYGSNIEHVSTGETGVMTSPPGQGGGIIPGEEECGNSIIETGEQCDDGGIEPGDGCDDFCQIESGYYCILEPSQCLPDIAIQCGNGGPCTSDGDCSTAQTCDITTQTCVQPGEECDDGNLINGDGCSAICTIETPECSDGIDNDGDGLIDLEDPDCKKEPNGTSESGEEIGG